VDLRDEKPEAGGLRCEVKTFVTYTLYVVLSEWSHQRGGRRI